MDSAPDEGWVVLPDSADAQPVVDRLPFSRPQVLVHPSGRPWLIGHWAPEEITLAARGPVRVVVIGTCPVTADRLARLTARVRTPADLDAPARALPGSVHVVASVHGQVRIHGTLTGLRRVFHTRIGRVSVAGDRADVLAWTAAAEVDEQALAVRLACRLLPPPLSEQSLWRGVRALSPDHCLLLNGGGAAREVRWWHSPEPNLPLRQGAAGVLAALQAAVAWRRPRRGSLGADLSGGMDSTSLCFLAASNTPNLLTVRWAEADDTNDDAAYAARAAGALDWAEHLVLPQDELPDVFADPQVPTDPEGPYAFARTAARTRYTAAVLAGHGVGLHLAGHGGDELFSQAPNYLHFLLRRHPVTALRHLRGYRAMHRWPLTATLSGLARSEDVSDWWRSQAAHLTDPTARRAPYLGWGPALRAPGWLTPQAVESARATLRATAEHAEPLAADRGQHQTLAVLRAMGPTYRQRSRLAAAAGIESALPFYDDRVVEAVLAVRLHERATPLRYKPLLAEAMRGTVPDAILDRTTKGQFSADLLRGLRRRLPEILEVFADSALAARGLLAPDVLRTALSAPRTDLTTVFALEDLLGCETWLRAVPPRRPPTDRKGMTDRAADP